MVSLYRLPLAALLAASSASASAWAQEGMALTPLREPAPTHEAQKLPPRPPAPIAQGGFVPLAARLPNQATGSRKERVVRDICIGC